MFLKSNLKIVEIFNLFDELIQNGIYFDEFLDICVLDLESVVQEEFYPIFARAISALDIKIFDDYNQAMDAIVYYHLDSSLTKGQDIYTEVGNLYYSIPHAIYDCELYGIAENICIKFSCYDREYNADHRSADEQRLINAELLVEAKKAFAYLQEKK